MQRYRHNHLYLTDAMFMPVSCHIRCKAASQIRFTAVLKAVHNVSDRSTVSKNRNGMLPGPLPAAQTLAAYFQHSIQESAASLTSPPGNWANFTRALFTQTVSTVLCPRKADRTYVREHKMPYGTAQNS